MYELPNAIAFDNGTHFASVMVIEICRDLGVQTKFASVVNSQANGQEESTNKSILKGLKMKLGDAKGLWAYFLHEILCSYHTTPHITNKETPFTMVYVMDAMLLVEIDTRSW